MQDFERFFEEDTVANENVVNDYYKWWESKFLPTMKENAEKLKYNCEHVSSYSEIRELRERIQDGKTKCNELVKAPFNGSTAIRLFIAYWVGDALLFVITLPFGGIGAIVATFVEIFTRDPNDSAFVNVKKSAKVGLEVLNTCDKILDAKEKEFKRAEQSIKKNK